MQCSRQGVLFGRQTPLVVHNEHAGRLRSHRPVVSRRPVNPGKPVQGVFPRRITGNAPWLEKTPQIVGNLSPEHEIRPGTGKLQTKNRHTMMLRRKMNISFPITLRYGSMHSGIVIPGVECRNRNIQPRPKCRNLQRDLTVFQRRLRLIHRRDSHPHIIRNILPQRPGTIRRRLNRSPENRNPDQLHIDRFTK